MTEIKNELARGPLKATKSDYAQSVIKWLPQMIGLLHSTCQLLRG